MPDELSLAVVGDRFDNVKRKGKPRAAGRWRSCCANLATR